MTKHDAPDSPAAAALSRRDFFAGAGMTAGALAALGGVAGSAWAPASQAAAANRRFFSTYVGMELDGVYAGNVLTAEGGEPVIVPGSPAQGIPNSLRIEPLTIRVGDMSSAVFDWIGKTSKGINNAKLLAIVAYDQQLKEIYRLTMQEVVLTGIATESFDAAIQEVLRFTIKATGTGSSHQLAGKTTMAATPKSKANQLRRANFRLYIQGLGADALRVRAIEPVGLALRQDGTLGPMPLKFSMAFVDAAPLVQWMQDTLGGKSGTRSGELQMLSPSLTTVAASISFDQLMITRVGCPFDSGADKIQLVEVECMPAGVKFNMGELLT